MKQREQVMDGFGWMYIMLIPYISILSLPSMLFLSDSFTLLSTSPSHFLHRDFKYLNSTPYNRRAFMTLFRRCYFSTTNSNPSYTHPSLPPSSNSISLEDS